METREQISRTEGRAAFGGDVAAYRRGRPEYPERVYEVLVERCGLGPDRRVLDIGAGSGLATRRLAERGANVIALEPDERFAGELDAVARESDGAVTPIFRSFEEAELPEGELDLVTAASSFHWIRREGLSKIGTCLRSRGWLAVWGNVFGDPREPDPFHEATKELLSPLANSPSYPASRPLPYALDVDERRADFRLAGAAEDFTAEEVSWTLVQTPDQVRTLYATFASISRLDERERGLLLDQLAAIAAKEFAGRVQRKIVTPIYTGRTD